MGATRSGKTYLDYFVIPFRIRRVLEKDGIVVILGVTKNTIQRNIIEPLQKIWGEKLVSNINSDSKCFMFGQWVHCLGAQRVSQVSKLQGAGIKYCYGDEVAKWHPEVFNMLKSRLDKPFSKFDGTCNPEYPSHWLKKFLDSDIDKYVLKFTIFDNPFLDKKFVKALCDEYSGTVYYDRYILGDWKRAEGICYPKFADNPNDFIVNLAPDDIAFAQVGVDFGGNGSAHAFQLTGFSKGFKKIVTLEEFYHDNKKNGIISPNELESQFVEFIKKCKNTYPFPIYDVFADSAEQTLIAGLKTCAVKNKLGVEIKSAKKGPVIDRIRLYNRLFSQSRYFIMSHCKATIDAFAQALWDNNSLSDKRLDNGSTNIDSLDAQEYSTENYAKDLTSI